MFTTNNLIKLFITSAVAISVTLFTGPAFSENPVEAQIDSIPKRLSDMTEEEKALLTEEQLKALEEAESAAEEKY